MAKKGSVVKRKLSLVFASDERDNLNRAIINANLVGRLQTKYPYDNGIQIDITFEDGKFKDLFNFGVEFGKLKQTHTPHKFLKCEIFRCVKGKCKNKKPHHIFSNLCKKHGEAYIKNRDKINAKNIAKFKASEKLKNTKYDEFGDEIIEKKETFVEVEPKIDFTIMLNPDNFRKK